jgi:hypothetical protein
MKELFMNNKQRRRDGENKPAPVLPETTGAQIPEAARTFIIAFGYAVSGLSPEAFTTIYNLNRPKADCITPDYLRTLATPPKHRGGHNKGKSSIPPEVWAAFCAAYTAPGDHSVQACYDAVKEVYPDIPSCKTFSRRFHAEGFQRPEKIPSRRKSGKQLRGERQGGTATGTP